MELKDCTLCNNKCHNTEEWTTKGSRNTRAGDENESLKSQLQVIFLLRKILEIPQDICCTFLENYGDPCSWIDCCNSCSALIENGKLIFETMTMLQKQFKTLQKQIKMRIPQALSFHENLAYHNKLRVKDAIVSFLNPGILTPNVAAISRNESLGVTEEDKYFSINPCGEKENPFSVDVNIIKYEDISEFSDNNDELQPFEKEKEMQVMQDRQMETESFQYGDTASPNYSLLPHYNNNLESGNVPSYVVQETLNEARQYKDNNYNESNICEISQSEEKRHESIPTPNVEMITIDESMGVNEEHNYFSIPTPNVEVITIDESLDVNEEHNYYSINQSAEKEGPFGLDVISNQYENISIPITNVPVITIDESVDVDEEHNYFSIPIPNVPVIPINESLYVNEEHNYFSTNQSVANDDAYRQGVISNQYEDISDFSDENDELQPFEEGNETQVMQVTQMETESFHSGNTITLNYSPSTHPINESHLESGNVLSYFIQETLNETNQNKDKNNNNSNISEISQSEDKRHKCEICGKSFLRPGLLTEHRRIHTGEKPFECKTCGKRFHASTNLRNHEARHNIEGCFICDICGRTFFFSKRLAKHKTRIHFTEKPHKCKICGKGYTTSANLAKHEKTHTGESKKQWICETCGRGFGTLQILNTHKLIHTGEKPFECEICGEAFNQSGSLTLHRKKWHTVETPYKCKICGKSYVLSSSLKCHEKCHTDGNSIQRETCETVIDVASELDTQNIL